MHEWSHSELQSQNPPCVTCVLQGFPCLCTSALCVPRPAVSLQHGLWDRSPELLPSAAKPPPVPSHASWKAKLVKWVLFQAPFLPCWDRPWHFSILTTGNWFSDWQTMKSDFLGLCLMDNEGLVCWVGLVLFGFSFFFPQNFLSPNALYWGCNVIINIICAEQRDLLMDKGILCYLIKYSPLWLLLLHPSFINVLIKINLNLMKTEPLLASFTLKNRELVFSTYLITRQHKICKNWEFFWVSVSSSGN